MLPNTIGNLKELRKFDIGGTVIKDLPNEMSNLTNLKSLAITRDQTTSFSKFGSHLSNLEELTIYPVPFQSYPWSVIEVKKFNNLPYQVNDCFNELLNNGVHINILV